MSAPSDRRGFLRGLVSLPLIGGGVTLIGSPSAVAAPVTRDLSVRYADWLMMERRILLMELFPDASERRFARDMWLGTALTDSFHLGTGWPVDWRDLPQPSTRAALVLAAVGCDWREGGR